MFLTTGGPSTIQASSLVSNYHYSYRRSSSQYGEKCGALSAKRGSPYLLHSPPAANWSKVTPVRRLGTLDFQRFRTPYWDYETLWPLEMPPDDVHLFNCFFCKWDETFGADYCIHSSRPGGKDTHLNRQSAQQTYSSKLKQPKAQQVFKFNDSWKSFWSDTCLVERTGVSRRKMYPPDNWIVHNFQNFVNACVNH